MTNDCAKEIQSREGSVSAYREYVKLLKELHSLIAQDRGDSEEADRLRDLMDDPWDRMSPEEIQRVRGLSADLYSLVDPPPPPRQLTQAEVDEFQRRAEAAWNNREWDRVLELLREQPHPFAADRVAFIRAACWANLGDLETAPLFLERAASLDPSNSFYQTQYLCTLIRDGRLADAISIADQIFDSKTCAYSELLSHSASTHVSGETVDLSQRQ
jgi:tetratricopeptide (TPR) repeat protein